MSGRKIAAATVQNRTQTPFWNYVRNKLLAVERQPVTPPPGLGSADGKCEYSNPLRFPKTQSARPVSAELPNLPGGVHHKIGDNYYLTRDGRHEVVPPRPLVVAHSTAVSFGTHHGEKLEKTDAVKVNIGPQSNFGLSAPTPGFGASWQRSRHNELDAPKNNAEFERLEKFDKFAKSS